MRILFCAMLCAVLVCACTHNQQNSASGLNIHFGDKSNVFNPYLQKTLPDTRRTSAANAEILKGLGGQMQSLTAEASHRPNWKAEIYPVVYGDPYAQHEILVLLDFASPRSAEVWQEVLATVSSLKGQSAKIVVFANSSEIYGTDLMGLAIWLTQFRKGQAMPYLDYALKRWNAVKAEQKRLGKEKPFLQEYDATAKSTDYPIIYTYLSGLQPAVSPKDELTLSRYCYEAGNVNLYQAVQISRYYGLTALPALIVDGKVLSQLSSGEILNNLH